jgi:hypothetical protein
MIVDTRRATSHMTVELIKARMIVTTQKITPK